VKAGRVHIGLHWPKYVHLFEMRPLW